jgi:hypothetical protein
MEPRAVPESIVAHGIGVPLTFIRPEGADPPVGDLQVIVLEDLRAVLEGRLPKSAKFISWWEPSEEERHKIAAGAPIRLVIIGATHINPMSITVGSTLEDLL